MSNQALVDVCSLGDLAMDSVLKVQAGGHDIALVRCVDGVFAIGNQCSHADVDLSEGEVEGCALECWLHGSQFDVKTGAPLTPPAIVPVPTYRVVLEGEGDSARVMIDPQPQTDN
ncbi:MAG TPA: non-heme iron oxygenase ferredoxin subunit [Candidatus Nanopelagicales bacterium]|nr:non-heme iron oxygenase ferredoxin subunit [Candidatus Nanopelagicales bacterium]